VRAILDHHPGVIRAERLDDRMSYSWFLVEQSSLRELAGCSLYVKEGPSVDGPPPEPDYDNPWAGWAAVFAIDERHPCLRAVYARSGPWSGGWPYPTPFSYFILRDDESDPAVDAGFEFGYEKYADNETRIDLIGPEERARADEEGN
jgi:hypothetical protein